MGSRKRSPSSSSSSSAPRKKVGGGGSFGGGADRNEPVVKIGPYKEIDDEEKRRKANGEPPLTLLQKDAMFRNYDRKQKGLPPIDITTLVGNDMGGGGGGGGGKGGKDKGKGKDKDKGKDKKGKGDDWTCPECGASVFASKRNCFKCGAD